MKTIGIIALSGACEEDKIRNAKNNLEALGYKVKLSENISAKNRYLAGSDDDKLEELYKFFQDSEIDLIMCARGGYGAIRLVNKIDYDILKKNPKPFCGFSDVTALLLMIYKKTGMVTYHGPMACSDLGEISVKVNEDTSRLIDFSGDCTPLQPSPFREGEISPHPSPLLLGEGTMFTWKCFLQALSGEKLEFQGNRVYRGNSCTSASIAIPHLNHLSQGEMECDVSGIIWGGNLATVVSLCGQDFIPDEDFIFFAEDLNEPVYKIDKMFQQLFNIEKFKDNCKGIVLGDFLYVDNDLWLEEYFEELAIRLKIPVAGGFKITHNDGKITVPIGRKCFLQDKLLVIP